MFVLVSLCFACIWRLSIKNYAETPKLFYSYIRRKKKGCMSVGPLRLPCGQLVDRPRHVAELFADTYTLAFASVFVENDPVRPAPYQVYGGRMHDLI